MVDGYRRGGSSAALFWVRFVGEINGIFVGAAVGRD
jgi:hypothetical protein